MLLNKLDLLEIKQGIIIKKESLNPNTQDIEFHIDNLQIFEKLFYNLLLRGNSFMSYNLNILICIVVGQDESKYIFCTLKNMY